MDKNAALCVYLKKYHTGKEKSCSEHRAGAAFFLERA